MAVECGKVIRFSELAFSISCTYCSKKFTEIKNFSYHFNDVHWSKISKLLRKPEKKVETYTKSSVFPNEKKFKDAFTNVHSKNKIKKEVDKQQFTNILQYSTEASENKYNNENLKVDLTCSSPEVFDEIKFENIFTNYYGDNKINKTWKKGDSIIKLLQNTDNTNESNCKDLELKTEVFSPSLDLFTNNDNKMNKHTEKSEDSNSTLGIKEDSISILESPPHTNEDKYNNIELKTKVDNVYEKNSKNFSKNYNVKRIKDDSLCPIKSCNEHFANRNLLDTHLKEYHSDNPDLSFKCPECNKLFKRKQKMKTHYKRVHLRERLFKCIFCDKRFFDKVDAVRHERTHTNETFCICEICGEGFTNGTALRLHRNRKHPTELELNIPQFKCKSCEKVFNNKQYLKSHFAVHSEKKFTCNICEMSFSWSSSLRRHMNVHNSERDFVCKICEKDFTSKVRITCHMKSHGLPYIQNNVYRKSQMTQFNKVNTTS